VGALVALRGLSTAAESGSAAGAHGASTAAGLGFGALGGYGGGGGGGHGARSRASSTVPSAAAASVPTITPAVVGAARAPLLPGSAEFERVLDELSAQPPTAVSLTNLWRSGLPKGPEQSLLNSQFLWRELRLRFAQRARQLRSLPCGLAESAALQEAIRIYLDVTAMLITWPKPRTAADEARFTEMLKATKPSSVAVPFQIGRALAERARTQPLSADEQRAVDVSLDQFFMSRIGHRFLIEHYLASRRPREGYSGIISGRCSPVAVCERAAESGGTRARDVGRVPSDRGHR
jgi:hypothetical protein